MSLSIIHADTGIRSYSFPRGYYVRAGFYMCLGWFLMSLLISLILLDGGSDGLG